MDSGRRPVSKRINIVLRTITVAALTVAAVLAVDVAVSLNVAGGVWGG